MIEPRILLIGYSGANNTGAEALLLADIADILQVFGPHVRITIPALDPAQLRRYVGDIPNVRIERLPTIFFQKVHRLTHEHDLVMLVEGSAYMDTWTSALLWYFLWATRCAAADEVPCLAYAVDAGELQPRNVRLVRRYASRTNLIVTRSTAAAERLRSWGVDAPIEVTADNALTFRPDPDDFGWLRNAWPEGGPAPVGIAAVDFSNWPVVVRPFGRAEDRYRWPYSFSRSPDRRRTSEHLAAGYARIADAVVQDAGRTVALIGMEQLDEPLARAIHARMRNRDRARIFSSRALDASKMTVLLRSLGALVTSRYHAAILSMAAAVPMVAVGHDLRLRTLFDELELAEAFVGPPADTDIRQDPSAIDAMLATASARLEGVVAAPSDLAASLFAGHERHLRDAQRNRELLRAFADAHGWGSERCAA
ncbi:MAG TPA: polysaccharide pyruvyl transferase family protein [Actinomycetota bacterium]|nr:polysaccharide pyruvyl transferase family protein [Actinomycetota bacterium]